MFFSCHHDFSSSFFIDFHLGQSFTLKSNLIFHFVFLFQSEEVLAFLLFILMLYHFGLLRFFLFLQKKGILNFLFFIVALFGKHIIVLTHLPFLLILHLNIEYFLNIKSIKNLKFTYFLTFFFISFFQSSDIISTLFCFLYFFPCFHFLLFKKSNSIGK